MGCKYLHMEGGGEGVPERFKEIALTTLYHLLYQRDRGGLPDVVGRDGARNCFYSERRLQGPMSHVRAVVPEGQARDTAWWQSGKPQPRRLPGRWAAALLLWLVGATSVWAQAPDSTAPLFTHEPSSYSVSTSTSEPSWFLETHRFWDRTNLTLHGTNLLAQGLDYWSTRNLVERNHRETNPLVRPFAGNDAALAAYKFGLSFGGSLAASHWLHRKGHHRWERLATMVVLGTTAPAVGLNFRFVF